ncbi:hypothetical protein DL95DRAFT_481765 [Leptodontidium sp. 2 PMI_412]|nr:hypothetical protein DL95DRAFT_481765 [Leptodontidium sp. 2 PMI_412]
MIKVRIIKGSSDRNRCKIQMSLGNLFYALGDFYASKDYYQSVSATISQQDFMEMSIGGQTFMAQANEGLATSLLPKNNLATIYHLQGRHSKTLKIFQNYLVAVPPKTEQLSHVLLVKHNLAYLHESIANLDEAISLLESTLTFKELKLGIRSPATLKAAITLARIYRKREDDMKAMELADRIYKCC